jgi:hypothetical protein
MGLMEITSLLKREVITPRLGESNDMLLIYGQSFSSLENVPGWEVTFQSRKCPNIYDEHSFSISENGPNQIIIFVMKIV